MKKKDAKIVVRCSKQFLARLKKAANKHGVYMSDLARNAIEHELRIILGRNK